MILLEFWRRWQPIILCSLPIIALGFLSVISLTRMSTSPLGAWNNYGTRQVLWMCGSLVIFFLIARLDFRWWIRNALIIYIVGLVLCISVIFFGREINGSRSWFDLGFMLFQPVEIMKIGLIMILARWYSSTNAFQDKWWVILFGAVFFVLTAAAVLLQPDLGSAILLAALWAVLTFTRGLTFWQWVVASITFFCTLAVGWFFILAPYQKERILSTFSTEANMQSYNVRQALIAIGNGGWWGQGIGQGSQTQLRFLPVRQTDFIFAALGEELGFVGLLSILIIYTGLGIGLVAIAWQARADDASYVVIGVSALLFVQIVVNIGMNIGIVPVTGIPLPFLSYGGSAFLSYAILLGIVANVAWQVKFRSLRHIKKGREIDYLIG